MCVCVPQFSSTVGVVWFAAAGLGTLGRPFCDTTVLVLSVVSLFPMWLCVHHKDEGPSQIVKLPAIIYLLGNAVQMLVVGFQESQDLKIAFNTPQGFIVGGIVSMILRDHYAKVFPDVIVKFLRRVGLGVVVFCFLSAAKMAVV
eukprot:TRINITY_DN2904_c0_g1_i3.p3 TRINITY_DN2904_c0_g1~~TRINITY_DN2904_c0_g1_i3.p3  ORF type:complete len:144 (+),score=41.06 TRINITY_DN2904_c0_g1_i3:500-931(+)